MHKTSPRLAGCQIGFLWDHASACWKLKVENQSICLFQVYVSNAASEYQAFVDKVNDALLRLSPSEYTVLMRDFNAYIGTDTET